MKNSFFTLKLNRNLLLLAWSCIGLSFFFAACKKNDIPYYHGKQYIQFLDPYTDTMSVAFFLTPLLDTLQVRIPVKYIGEQSTEDIAIGFEVNAKETTADADVYQFRSNPVLRKGLATDTLYLSVYKKQNLKGKEALLVIDLKQTDRLTVGETIKSRKVLRLSDKITRPKWWDALIENTYLGKYSDKKYRTFIEVTGEGDLEPYTIEQKRDLMLQFKYYLIDKVDKGTPVLEDDGKDMLSTVPLIG